MLLTHVILTDTLVSESISKLLILFLRISQIRIVLFIYWIIGH